VCSRLQTKVGTPYAIPCEATKGSPADANPDLLFVARPGIPLCTHWKILMSYMCLFIYVCDFLQELRSATATFNASLNAYAITYFIRFSLRESRPVQSFVVECSLRYKSSFSSTQKDDTETLFKSAQLCALNLLPDLRGMLTGSARCEGGPKQQHISLFSSTSMMVVRIENPSPLYGCWKVTIARGFYAFLSLCLAAVVLLQ
jgi:hypothetical protein